MLACYDSDVTLKTSITDPRLAFALEEKVGGKEGLIRQRFDASSTALQVLQGRDLTDQYVIVTGANSGIGAWGRRIGARGRGIGGECPLLCNLIASVAVRICLYLILNK